MNETIIGLKKFNKVKIIHRVNITKEEKQIATARLRRPHCYWKRGEYNRRKKVSKLKIENKNKIIARYLSKKRVNRKYYVYAPYIPLLTTPKP